MAAVDLLARCVRGLEWVAAAEISALPGVGGVTLAAREVAFRMPTLDRAVLGLRSVDDVFLPAGTIPAVGRRKDDLAALRRADIGDVLRAIDRVRAIRGLPGRPAYDVAASLAGRHNYNRYAAEDALAQGLAGVLGRHISHDPSRRDASAGPADVTVRLMLRDGVGALAVRVAAAPLHRRLYKQRTGPATLHPPVAAAMAMVAGPGRLLDPCCGDGTIAIEFTRAYPGYAVIGADLAPDRIANAAANATAADVRIGLVVADAAAPPVGVVDRIVANPPWSRSVDLGGAASGEPAAMWRALAGVLDRDGAMVVIGEERYDVPARLAAAGLRIILDQSIRLAGRVSQIVTAVPPGGRATLPSRLGRWRRAARAAGVLADEGF